MTGTELYEFARMVGRSFQAKWWFDGDADDVAQDAAEAVIRYHRKKRLPIKGHRSLYFHPATCEARIGWNRARAVVTMGERASVRSNQYVDRTPIVGCGYDAGVVFLDKRGPHGERQDRDAAAARERMLGILEDHVATLAPTERQVVAMLLGIGGQLRQMDPDEVYEATGLKAAAVWAIVRRFGKVVRQDKGALRARRAYLSHQEAA